MRRFSLPPCRRVAVRFARHYIRPSSTIGHRCAGSFFPKRLPRPVKSPATFSSMSSPSQDHTGEAAASASAKAPGAPEVDSKECEASTANSSEPQEAASSASGSTSEPELPALTPQEFRIYNRLAETMDYFVGGAQHRVELSLSRGCRNPFPPN